MIGTNSPSPQLEVRSFATFQSKLTAKIEHRHSKLHNAKPLEPMRKTYSSKMNSSFSLAFQLLLSIYKWTHFHLLTPQ